MEKLSSTTGFGLFQEKDLADAKKSLSITEEQEKYKKEINLNWRDFIYSFNAIISYLNDWTKKVRDSVNRINLIYQNQGTVVTITIAVADTNTAGAHGLNYIPAYFLIVDSDIAGYICKGAAWDTTNVSFKAGDTGTFKTIVW